MIRTFCIFLLVFFAIWLGTQLNTHPGYVIIAWQQWTIQCTLSIALIIFLAILFISHIMMASFNWLAHAPQLWRHFQTKHKIQAAQAKTRKGLIEFSEGHWLQAKNHLINALPNAETPLLNYLTAARAAQELGDNQLRDNFLREAQQAMPEAKIAVELTQAQLQMAHKQWEQALATLRHLHDLSPRHPYVLKLLLQLYEEVKDWPQLIRFLPELRRNRVVSESESNRIEKRAYTENLLDLTKQDQTSILQEKFKLMPKWLQQDPDIVLIYAQYFICKEQYEVAESVIHHCLKKQTHPALIVLYGQIPLPYVHLKFAESLLKIAPHSYAVYLCLGQIYQASQLLTQAKEHYEKSLEIHATAEAYLFLGGLLEQIQDNDLACQTYQKGLTLAILSKQKA